MKSVIRLKIKSSAIDFNEHVNYLVYPKLYLKGQNKFWGQYGLSFIGILKNYGVHTFIRHIEISYNKQVFEGDTVYIHTLIDKIGTTSLTFKQYIKCLREIVNEAKIVIVFTQDGKPVPIPDGIRKLI